MCHGRSNHLNTFGDSIHVVGSNLTGAVTLQVYDIDNIYPAQTLIHSIVAQECPGYLSPVRSPQVFADSLSCQLFLRHVPVT